jgi:hypothetical protein
MMTAIPEGGFTPPNGAPMAPTMTPTLAHTTEPITEHTAAPTPAPTVASNNARGAEATTARNAARCRRRYSEHTARTALRAARRKTCRYSATCDANGAHGPEESDAVRDADADNGAGETNATAARAPRLGGRRSRAGSRHARDDAHATST